MNVFVLSAAEFVFQIYEIVFKSSNILWGEKKRKREMQILKYVDSLYLLYDLGVFRAVWIVLHAVLPQFL